MRIVIIPKINVRSYINLDNNIKKMDKVGLVC